MRKTLQKTSLISALHDCKPLCIHVNAITAIFQYILIVDGAYYIQTNFLLMFVFKMGF